MFSCAESFNVAKLDKKHNDELLTAFVEYMSTFSGCVAACLLTGRVHGYRFQTSLIQMEDGAIFRQAWIEGVIESDISSIRRVEGDFDLQQELLLLHTEDWSYRGNEPAIHNIDQKSGMEGRVATLFTVKGMDANWFICSRLLLDGKYSNNALNRILLTLEDLAGKVTLV